MNRTFVILLAGLALAGAVTWFVLTQLAASNPDRLAAGTVSFAGRSGGYDGYGELDLSQISFRDDAPANAATVVPIGELSLLDQELQPVSLADVQGDRSLVLVILRGVPLCPFCSAQTSRLVSNYSEFATRGAEVVVVFPGTADHLRSLLRKAKVDDQELPFPILVDTKQETIRRLDIAADLARPSTFIIDSKGRTQFAYVGDSRSDRPSISSMLAALDRLMPQTTEPDPTDG